MTCEEEIFVFERFLQRMGLPLDYVKSESPDFIIHKDKQRVGFELIELIFEEIGGIPIAQKYSFESKIVNLVKIECEKILDKNIYVTITFQDKLHIDSKRTKRLVHETTSLIIRNLQNMNWDEYCSLEIQDDLPPEIMFVFIYAFPALDHSFFYPTRSKWTGNIMIDDLNLAIQKKNQIVSRYRKNVDLINLIIVEKFSAKSSHGDFIHFGSLLKHDFDRIFLFDSLNSILNEINYSSA